MSPSLLVLGGGAFVAPVLHWAREAGLSTVLADADPHAPARRAAREFHAIPARDVEAHAALARRVAKAGGLAGILASTSAAHGLLAPLSDAVPGVLPPRSVLERLLDAEQRRAFLGSRGFRVADAEPARAHLDLYAFFRDGAFVPGGIATRSALGRGDVASVQPGLDVRRERAAYELAERAARDLGLEHGLLQVTLVEVEGELALVALHPCFVDLLGATQVARLAYGRSPLEAWFAHLVGAGGPFDQLALTPRAAAGWLSVAPERAGFFAGVDGAARARALPGVADLWFEEPGRDLAAPGREARPLGYLWAEGRDREELEARLTSARAALRVRSAHGQPAV